VTSNFTGPKLVIPRGHFGELSAKSHVRDAGVRWVPNTDISQQNTNMKPDDPLLKLILLSVHDESSVCRDALEAGADAFVIQRAIATALLSLTGAMALWLYGFQSVVFSDFFTEVPQVWQFAPSVTIPLDTGVRRCANLKITPARAGNYEKLKLENKVEAAPQRCSDYPTSGGHCRDGLARSQGTGAGEQTAA